MEVEVQIGRTPEVTDKQVIDAGLNLEQDGQRVSGYKLRRDIGAGMPSRLMKIWEEYKEAHGGIVVATEAPDDIALPPEVEDSLRLMLGQLNESIESLASQTNSAAVQAAEKRVKSEYDAFKKAKEDAQQDIGALEIALTQIDTKAAQLEDTVATKEGEIRTLSGQLESAKTTTKTVQDQLGKAVNENELLRSENVKLKSELKETEISARTFESEAKRLLEELDKANESLNSVKSDLAKTEKSNIQLSMKLENETNLSKKMTEEIAKFERKLEDLKEATDLKTSEFHDEIVQKSEALGQASEKCKSAEEKLKASEAKNDNLQKELAELKKANSEKKVDGT